MNAKAIRRVVTLALLAACGAWGQTSQPTEPGAEGSAKPLMLEKNQGELRTRRPRTDNRPVAAAQFMLKVSPKNNGSQHLVLGTEEIAPGGGISKHRHLEQDEILLIQSGMGHVWLGDQESDVHAGGMVFIPTHTWISLKNTGTEPLGLTFIFSAPGFEDMMRCNSVGAGEKLTPISPEERRKCVHLGHAEYEDLQEKPRN
jgi:mannose-6-phosphate isomerase-like protein (cupin superfamily)